LQLESALSDSATTSTRLVRRLRDGDPARRIRDIRGTSLYAPGTSWRSSWARHRNLRSFRVA
jgi:hypothetical protein